MYNLDVTFIPVTMATNNVPAELLGYRLFDGPTPIAEIGPNEESFHIDNYVDAPNIEANLQVQAFNAAGPGAKSEPPFVVRSEVVVPDPIVPGVPMQVTGVNATLTLAETDPPIDPEPDPEPEPDPDEVLFVNEIDRIIEDTLVEVAPKSVWFYKIITGQEPGVEQITIYNPSAVDVSIASAVNTNPRFEIIGDLESETIKAGHARMFFIRYTPDAGGPIVQTGTLTLTFDNGQQHRIGIWSSKFDAPVSIVELNFAANNRVLNMPNADYYLNIDFETAQTAIILAARHIHLRLESHDIVYGSDRATRRYGVVANRGGGGFSEGCKVSGGRIIQFESDLPANQRGPAGDRCYGMLFDEQNGDSDIILEDLEILTHGPNAHCVRVNGQPTGYYFHNMLLRSDVKQIDSRDHFDGAMIKCGSQGGTGGTPTKNRYENVTLLDGPQAGVYDSSDGYQIYHCHAALNGRFSNDFAFSPNRNAEVFLSTVRAISGRGVFVGHVPNAHVWGLDIEVTELEQNDEYNGCQAGGAYGLQFEGKDTTGARIYHNRSVAKAGVCNAIAMRVTEGGDSGDNMVIANYLDAQMLPGDGKAFTFSYASGGLGQPLIARNRCKTDFAFFDQNWSAAVNNVLRRNSFEEGDNPRSGGVFFGYFHNGNANEWATGTRHIDPTFGPNVTPLRNSAAPISGGRRPYSFTIERSLDIIAVGAGSAAVEITDVQGNVVADVPLSGGSFERLELVQFEVKNTTSQAQVVTSHTDHNIRVVGIGNNFDNTMAIIMDKAKRISVNVDTGTITEI